MLNFFCPCCNIEYFKFVKYLIWNDKIIKRRQINLISIGQQYQP